MILEDIEIGKGKLLILGGFGKLLVDGGGMGALALVEAAVGRGA